MTHRWELGKHYKNKMEKKLKRNNSELILFSTSCLIHNLQECTIDMNVGDEDLKRVTLVPGGINIRQKSMTAFTFKDVKLVYANEKKRGIQMKLRIKRKITSEILTTYFP